MTRSRWIVPALLVLALQPGAAQHSKSAAPQAAAATSASPNAALKAKIEASVRHLFALGPSFEVKAGEPKESPLAGLLQVDVAISFEGQGDTVQFLVSRDARFLFRGDLIDTATDPFATARSQMNLEGAPSKGPADAAVTVVVYSDFQCPSCQALHQNLRALLPQYPRVRLVFKDFALVQIHPWAQTAHVAARCALRQSPETFWKLHDMIFDRQENITPANAWETILDYGVQVGMEKDTLRACMLDPAVKAEIDASYQEGLKLRVANTPTVFVNGRRIVGGDRQTIEQFIQYELAAKNPARKQ